MTNKKEIKLSPEAIAAAKQIVAMPMINEYLVNDVAEYVECAIGQSKIAAKWMVVCDNCGVEQHDQIDRICTTCLRGTLHPKWDDESRLNWLDEHEDWIRPECREGSGNVREAIDSARDKNRTSKRPIQATVTLTRNRDESGLMI
jgi:hypothetical protein